jgi:hypothetical protein
MSLGKHEIDCSRLGSHIVKTTLDCIAKMTSEVQAHTTIHEPAKPLCMHR